MFRFNELFKLQIGMNSSISHRHYSIWMLKRYKSKATTQILLKNICNIDLHQKQIDSFIILLFLVFWCIWFLFQYFNYFQKYICRCFARISISICSCYYTEASLLCIESNVRLVVIIFEVVPGACASASIITQIDAWRSCIFMLSKHIRADSRHNHTGSTLKMLYGELNGKNAAKLLLAKQRNCQVAFDNCS